MSCQAMQDILKVGAKKNLDIICLNIYLVMRSEYLNFKKVSVAFKL